MLSNLTTNRSLCHTISYRTGSKRPSAKADRVGLLPLGADPETGGPFAALKPGRKQRWSRDRASETPRLQRSISDAYSITGDLASGLYKRRCFE